MFSAFRQPNLQSMHRSGQAISGGLSAAGALCGMPHKNASQIAGRFRVVLTPGVIFGLAAGASR
ncbi:MAG: hypothetical protein ACLP19_17170, partial [Xanthobacteraceae bacterium]